MSLISQFDSAVQAQPHAPALIDLTGRRAVQLSFADLQSRSRALAARLAADGLAPGERVLLALPVSADLYTLLLALWRLGAVAVLPDPAAPRSLLDDACARLAPVALAGSAKAQLLRLVSPAVRRLPRHYANTRLPLTRYLDSRPGTNEVGDYPTRPDDPALITFTSGSTGRPKIASRSQAFLLAQYRAVQRTLGLEAGQVDLTSLPVFVLANLAAGVATVLPPGGLSRPGGIDPGPVLAAMRRHGVNRASGSPAFFRRLLDGLDAGGPAPRLRSLHTGGAPVTPALLADYARLTADGDCWAVYGSTEAEPIAERALKALSAAERDGPAAGRGLPAGTPVTELDLAILDPAVADAGPDLTETVFAAGERPAGEVGEIVVAGDHVLAGYLDGAGDADTKLKVAGRVWHRTGDLGYREAGGDLWLLGRRSAACHWQGQTLYPFALEYPALADPAVARAALLPVDDAPVLAVEPSPGHTIDPARLAAALPVPLPASAIRILERIPLDRRHNAKVDYGRLRALLAG